MDLANSSDIFQSVMHPLFQDISAIEYFIYDICVYTSGTFDTHLVTLHQVLFRLEESVFTINPLNCDCAVQSTDNLGFLLLTTSRIKLLRHKIEAISCIAPPTATMHIHLFFGLINYYKDLWPYRAYI